MQKFINLIRLPFLAALIIAFIYGGLNLQNLNAQVKELNAQNRELKQKQISLEDSQNVLENDLSSFENQNAELNEKIKNYESQLKSSQKQIASLQKLINTPKEILGASTTAETQETPKVEVKPAIAATPAPQIITKTKTVVKEVEKNQAVVTVENLGSYRVNLTSADTAFTILKKAGQENGFEVEYQEFSFGVFVTAIGGMKPSGNQYWAFYYNGKYSQVGASEQAVFKDDTTYWKLESF